MGEIEEISVDCCNYGIMNCNMQMPCMRYKIANNESLTINFIITSPSSSSSSRLIMGCFGLFDCSVVYGRMVYGCIASNSL